MFPPCRIPLIDNAECSQVVQRIYELKYYWQERQENFFYTLGLPAYQYIDNLDCYYQVNTQLNGLLYNSFRNLYDLVLTKLSAQFNEAVSFFPSVAIPGFHLYFYSEIQNFYGGGPHFDLSYKALLRENHQVKSEDNYSYVLSISLPESGAGLDLWDRTCFDDAVNPMTDDEAVAVCTKHYVPYIKGELLIFNGNMMHQIAPLFDMQSTDTRITFQGHIIRVNDQLLTYW